ncbi:MAG: BamA/TamA family outer membrane protein [Chitinispirillaceae bacterium]|nr:BamA/TamA family outer membrane protein [Chitinispirillaceae bacterium]
MSPSISLSRSGIIAATVFSKSDYQIRLFQTGPGEPFTARYDEYIANVSLPPQKRADQTVLNYLKNLAIPEVDSMLVTDYQPRLRLYNIGQFYGGIQGSPYGVGVGGGALVVFSNLLGNYLTGAGVQISGGWLDIAGELFYLNRDARLNWGVSFSHIPSRITETTSGTDTMTIDGNSTLVSTSTLVQKRTFQDQFRFQVEYPLSLNRRIEAATSYSRIYYNYSGEVVSGNGNQILERTSIPVDDPSGLNIFSTAGAFVGDFSFFGLKSPIRGRRYRSEVQPTLGSLNFISALADYRQYLFLRPFTLAYRLYQYGRYFGDSDNDRLSFLFLGNQALVRGYSYFSFDLTNCSAANNFQGCPDFNRLIGSRLAVANVEFRIPLIGPEPLAIFPFPFLPVEIAPFFDAGVAWTSQNLPQFDFSGSNGERTPVFSTGGALRIGLLNLLVFQFYLAYPFQRSDKSWDIGLLIAPGW